MRLGYLDALRGIAVLLMIEYHTADSWLADSARRGTFWNGVSWLGGMAAPLFLALAGVSLALAGESAMRKGATPRQAARAAVDRALWLWGVAYLFRLQLYLTGGRGAPPESLLRVDVLNCIAVSLVIAAAGLLVRDAKARVAAWAAGAIAVAAAAPLVSRVHWPRWVPAHIADYLWGAPPGSLFPIFPWAAFALGGAALGGWISGKPPVRASLKLVAAGVVLFAGAGLVARADISPYGAYDWWRASPTWVSMRFAVILAFTGALALIEPWAARVRFRPLVMLGRSSLFVYWVHIELVYGNLFYPFKRVLTPSQVTIGIGCVVLLMAVATWVKQRWWEPRGKVAAAIG